MHKIKRAILIIGLATWALPAHGDVNVGALSRAIANGLYCQLSGCTMTGAVRLPDGSLATPALSRSGNSTHGWRWSSAPAFLLGDGTNTQLALSQSVALNSGGAVSFSSSGTDATATPDLRVTRIAAGVLQIDNNSAAAMRLSTASLTAARTITPPDADIVPLSTNSAQTVTATHTFSTSKHDRLVSAAGLVATASVTGFGSSPTVSLLAGSTDLHGRFQITAGTTPGASGTIVVTFSTGSAYGTNASDCVAILANTASGTWNARATVIATAGGALTTSHSFTWDNNSSNVTAGAAYGLQYWCGGR